MVAILAEQVNVKPYCPWFVNREECQIHIVIQHPSDALTVEAVIPQVFKQFAATLAHTVHLEELLLLPRQPPVLQQLQPPHLPVNQGVALLV